MAPNVPPPTIVFGPGRPTVNQPPPPATYGAPSWTPAPVPPKRKVWPWVVGILIVLFLLACGLAGALLAISNLSTTPDNPRPSPSPFATQRPTPTPEPSPTPAETTISGIHMAHDRGDGEPGGEGSKFTPSERILHCVIELSGNQPGTVISFRWIAVDAGELKNSQLKEMTYTTKGQEPGVHADLTRHEDWVPGDWKVDVYLDGRFARTVAFTVE
jgi:hypothetical protein